MKVIILAGGFGTRIADVNDNIPKPLIEINNKPLIWHTINHYSRYDCGEFYIALGHLGNKIKEYFLNFNQLNSNFKINLKKNKITQLDNYIKDWDVNLINTGQKTMTGGRIKRLQKYIGKERFMVSYGDSVCDVDIKKLISFHNSHGKIGTVTAVHPQARFGELTIKDDTVIDFKEKPQINSGWINGGFFVFEPEFFEYLENDETILEKEPLERLAKNNELKAYKHDGFWHCVDTRRDKDNLEKIFNQNK